MLFNFLNVESIGESVFLHGSRACSSQILGVQELGQIQFSTSLEPEILCQCCHGFLLICSTWMDQLSVLDSNIY